MNNKKVRSVLMAALALPLAATSHAAEPAKPSASPVLLAQADEGKCRKSVNDYLGALSFIRSSGGTALGDRVSKAYVSEQALQGTVNTEGYCGAEKLLRDKGLVK